MAKKSAREKLAVKKQINIVVMDKTWGGMMPGDTMLVATPLMVDAHVRSIPPGKTETLPELRDALAKAESLLNFAPLGPCAAD